jgi:hypothetical protein
VVTRLLFPLKNECGTGCPITCQIYKETCPKRQSGCFVGHMFELKPANHLSYKKCTKYIYFFSTKCFHLVTNEALVASFYFQMLLDMIVEHTFVRPQTELTILSRQKSTSELYVSIHWPVSCEREVSKRPFDSMESLIYSPSKQRGISPLQKGKNTFFKGIPLTWHGPMS